MENGELSLTHKRNLDNINITTRLGHCQSCRSSASPVYLLQAVVTNPGEFIVGDTVSRADVVQEQALDGGQYVGVNVRLHLIYPVFLISS